MFRASLVSLVMPGFRLSTVRYGNGTVQYASGSVLIVCVCVPSLPTMAAADITAAENAIV
jgi:hypothetical protein